MPSFVQACIGWYQSFETSLFTVYLRLHTIAPLSSPLSSKTVLSATSEMCPGSRLFEACQTPFAVRVGARMVSKRLPLTWILSSLQHRCKLAKSHQKFVADFPGFTQNFRFALYSNLLSMIKWQLW